MTKIQQKKRKSPTPRQTKAAHAVVKNLLSDKPKSVASVLESVGYGSGLQNSPQRVMESEGMQTALKEIGLQEALMKQGVTPEKIAEKIDVLLDAKKKTFINNVEVGTEDDFTAIDKGLRHATAIHGIIPQGGGGEVKNTYNFIFSAEVQSKVRDINEDIKNLLRKGNDKEN